MNADQNNTQTEVYTNVTPTPPQPPVNSTLVPSTESLRDLAAYLITTDDDLAYDRDLLLGAVYDLTVREDWHESMMTDNDRAQRATADAIVGHRCEAGLINIVHTFATDIVVR